MNDDALFASAPYIAACAMPVAAVWFLARSDWAIAVERRQPGGDGVAAVGIIVRGASLALVALHILLLSAPDVVLGWNRDERRLLTLESAGLVVGAVCLIALVGSIWRQRRVSDRGDDTPIGDVVMLTLVGIEMVSGLTLALLYRWASSWSAVTLTPYVVSLVHLNPRVELVASLPFLVRLHVFSTFAIAVAIPFTTVGAAVLAAVRRVAAPAAAPVARASHVLVAAAGERTRRLVRPLVSSNDERS